MSNLADFAKRELEAEGCFDPERMYGGMIGDAVLKLIELFSKQGHSGASASIVRSLFTRLANFEPLGPLTGEDSEWTFLGNEPDMWWQNNRCFHVFKRADGTAWDGNAVIFKEPDGSCYTNSDSRKDISFPYTPKHKYVDVPARAD